MPKRLTTPLRIEPECDPGDTVPTRYHVFNAEGDEVVSMTCSQERAEFIVACVSALAGTEDPEAFIKGLQSMLSRTVDHLRKVLEKAEPPIMNGFDFVAALEQANRAELMLREIERLIDA